MNLLRIHLFALLFLGLTACQSEENNDNADLAVPHGEEIGDRKLTDSDRKKLANGKGKTVEAVNFSELQALFEDTEDQLIICNFWATWCAPCIKEMPYFDQLQDEFADQNVKVLFVSLDNPAERESRVTTFIREKQFLSEVILLDEQELSQDEWITQLTSNWEGDIPATYFVKTSAGVKEFYAGEFTDYNELKAKILPYL